MNILNRLFNSDSSSHGNEDKTINQPARNDGYTSYNARVICAFQAELEARGCDYSALSATLQYGRTINDYKLTPVGLYAHYEEQARGWMYQD